MGYGGGGVVWWFFAHSGLAKWTYMHPKCAGMEKIRASDHNIRYIALKVSNFEMGISGFCGFGVLVMSGCACACDG